MRLAIIGGGFGVDGHLPAFRAVPGVNIVVVADSGSGRIRDRLPTGIAYAGSWQEALSMPVDAVSVAVPPAQQCEIVLASLSRNMHVFCEKPFGLNAEEAETMNAAALSATVCVAGVNFQFRFEPGLEALRERIVAGAIGTTCAIDLSWVTSGRANPGSPWSWRNDAAAGGGVIGAFFSHAADLFWWLTGAEPQSVFGQSRILVAERPDAAGTACHVTAEDAVTAQLEMNGGITATCRITNCQPGGDGMRLEVRGSEGVLVYRHAPPFGPADSSLVCLKKEAVAVPISTPPPECRSAETRLWAVHRCAGQFVRRVRGDQAAAFPAFADGLRAQQVIAGLRESIASRRNVMLRPACES
ncbi:MAG: Gfo/Idh/MocA family oxidoreductase [Anaerolineae bacterium]|nr:Gfo/Idh/MocA family oxidoreductase [Anaerolineae bacterium]